jgi:hypothetical protein
MVIAARMTSVRVRAMRAGREHHADFGAVTELATDAIGELEEAVAELNRVLALLEGSAKGSEVTA